MPFYRVYVEKKPHFNTEAKLLKKELISMLDLKGLSDLRIIHRYDVANIDLIDFYNATSCVFSSGQCDVVYSKEPEFAPNERVFAVESQPDRSDICAKMCAEEIAMLTKGPIPIVKHAAVYVLKGILLSEEIEKIKKYLINPLLLREAVLEPFDGEIEVSTAINEIAQYEDVKGFISTAEKNASSFLNELGIKISDKDAVYIQNHFKTEDREPTVTELKIIEFMLKHAPTSVANTKIKEITIDSPYINKTYRKYTAKRKEIHNIGNINVTISDIANLTQNKINSEFTQNICMHDELSDMDPSGSAADGVKIALNSTFNSKSVPVCISRTGAMPNPMVKSASGFSSKKLCEKSAKGAAYFANLSGIPTISIREKYNKCFSSKPLNIISVIGKKQEKNENAEAGDVIFFAGSYESKTPREEILFEQQKIIKLLKNEKSGSLIKKCISADFLPEIFSLEKGINIELDKILSVANLIDSDFSKTVFIVSKENVSLFKKLALDVMLTITQAGIITEDNYVTILFNGKTTAHLNKNFISSLQNVSSAFVSIKNVSLDNDCNLPNNKENWAKTLAASDICSQRGIIELFDSTVGGKTVLGPLCGECMLTPSQASKISVSQNKLLVTSSAYLPSVATASPYHASIYSVILAISKNIAAGGSCKSMQISYKLPLYRILKDMPHSSDWKNIFSAMLGIFEASSQFTSIFKNDASAFDETSNPNLPAATYVSALSESNITSMSPDFKTPGNKVILIAPRYDSNGIPNFTSLKECFEKVETLVSNGTAKSVYALTKGGVCEAISKMCFGSRLGFAFSTEINRKQLFEATYGGFLIEVPENFQTNERVIGKVTPEYKIVCSTFTIEADELQAIWEAKLESVYPCRSKPSLAIINRVSYNHNEITTSLIKTALPKVVIPVFYGSTGINELAYAFEKFGAKIDFCFISSQDQFSIQTSVNDFVNKLSGAQIIAIPGGYAGADQPDGAGKYINSFIKNSTVSQAINQLLVQRDGLIIGLGNGFQALLKSGLITNGKVSPVAQNAPSLIMNSIGRTQSKIIKTRISSDKSPWTYGIKPGTIHTIPVSHSQGRFVASNEVLQSLAENGQIIAQYVDSNGTPATDIRFNPNYSVWSVESICSPDGHVLGKMAHNERCNPLSDEHKIFENGIKYFK